MAFLERWLNAVAKDSGIDPATIKIENAAVKRKKKELRKSDGMTRKGAIYKTGKLN